MCTAVRIAVLATTRDRRMVLRRAAVGVAWQVVAAVGDVDEAIDRLTALRGRLLVVDGDVDGARTGDAAARVRADVPDVLLVGVGQVVGTDAIVPHDDLGRLPHALAEVLHASGDHSH